LDEPIHTSIEVSVGRRTGFKVTGHRLEVLGLCLGCQQ
jgi:Fe2+ or Zn2+ uptake regulation protein